MTAPAHSSQYRPDIDALRAIAVVSVLLFHVDLKWFGGGYFGVDIFFVISGYLITKVIRDGVAGDRFSFGDFYLRRARRLFPALFVTIALTFLVGAYLLVPYHLERLGAATVGSLFWFSNILFWSESGYFDTDALVKPLLHTWSLSVEEQFYLLWPATVVALSALSNRAWLFVGILLISLLSLAASEWMSAQDASAAFFLVPFRAYEFGIGALTLWVVQQGKLPGLLLDLICAAGLAGIAACVVLFDEDTNGQGIISLVACLSAAMVLYSGTAPRFNWLLGNAAMVYVGRISYSLYLVHWPVVVFYRYREESFSNVDQAIVLALSVVFAVLLHHFVENPLRRPKDPAASPKKFVLGALLSTLFIALPAAHAWATAGWSWRWNVPGPILTAVAEFSTLREASWRLVKDFDDANRPVFEEKDNKVLLIGDSHSKDLFNALYKNLEPSDAVSLRRLPLQAWCVWKAAGANPPAGAGRMVKNKCRAQSDSLFTDPLLADADRIALSLRWSDESIRHLPGLIERLRSLSSAELVIAGRTAEFPDIPLLALDYGRMEGLDAHAAEVRNKALDELNHRISAVAAQLEVGFLDKHKAVCDQAGARCSVFYDQSDILMYDESHWTLAGARYYGDVMRQSGALTSLGILPSDARNLQEHTP